MLENLLYILYSLSTLWKVYFKRSMFKQFPEIILSSSTNMFRGQFDTILPYKAWIIKIIHINQVLYAKSNGMLDIFFE